MRVAVYYANDDVRLEERPLPEIGHGELLLRVEASGICGSDVLEWYRKPRAPLVLGHEVAGVVERVGEGVLPFRPGDRVVTTHHVPCNRCHYCLTDRHSACDLLHRTSFDPGGFAEFVRLSAIHVAHGTFHLPPDVTFEQGSFVEPLACAVRAQRLAGVRPAESVAVLGCGLAGILHLALARATGVGRLFATDANDERVGRAPAFGADLALRADAEVVPRILEANGGRGVERVIVCTAAASAMEQALELADRGGSVLYYALLEPGQTPALSLHELWRKGLSIIHSYAGPPAEMRTALELIATRRVDVLSMITHRLPLEGAALGFRLTAAGRGSLKVVLEPQR